MRILIAAVLAVAALSVDADALDEPALLADINQETSGLPVQRLTAAGARLFFTAGTSLGNELWSSDGTPGGTGLARDINPFGSGDPDWLTDVGGTLFFSADDGVSCGAATARSRAR
jgi:ELWxxDGT repeat protein